jgi:multicomponent Na+:H+ antiporter subunit A
VPLLFGHPPLDHRSFEVDLPVFGTVKATSALIFDTGVYLVVIGLALGVLVGMGEDHAEAQEATS